MYSLAACFVAPMTNSAPSDASLAEFYFDLFVNAPTNLAITILLAIGGLRLRDLRASGAWLLRLGLWIDFMSIVIRLLMMTLLLMTLPAWDDSTSTVATLFNVFQMFLGLVVLTFEIVSLVWLTHHSAALSLDPNT
jgi:hypothetical protein